MKDLETIATHSTQHTAAQRTEHSTQHTADSRDRGTARGHGAQVALTVDVSMSLLSPLTATGVYCTAATVSIQSFYDRLAGFLDVSSQPLGSTLPDS